MRLVEYKLRHWTLVTGITPYMAVHRFAGSSALSTAMGAIQAIPEDVIGSDWVASIALEAKRVNSTLADHWNDEADLQARKHAESKSEPGIGAREQALLRKGHSSHFTPM